MPKVTPSVVAVDLGGTKLSTALVDAQARATGHTKQPAVRGELRASVDQIASAVRAALAAAPDAQVAGVGLIIPGIVAASTGLAWAPNLWGDNHVPLYRELSAQLELPLTIGNDRAGCLLGERWQGVARDLTDVVFVTVGTGIGAGILSGGRVLDGAGGIAGSAGWFALSREHTPLYAAVGCWEAEAAGPALARRLNAPSAEPVIAAARAGDCAALAAVHATAEALGLGIANLVSLLNPQMVVLGGGLMQAGDLFLPAIRATVSRWAQPVAARQVAIELSQLGPEAPLLGAARLALDAAGAN